MINGICRQTKAKRNNATKPANGRYTDHERAQIKKWCKLARSVTGGGGKGLKIRAGFITIDMKTSSVHSFGTLSKASHHRRGTLALDTNIDEQDKSVICRRCEHSNITPCVIPHTA